MVVISAGGHSFPIMVTGSVVIRMVVIGAGKTLFTTDLCPGIDPGNDPGIDPGIDPGGGSIVSNHCCVFQTLEDTGHLCHILKRHLLGNNIRHNGHSDMPDMSLLCSDKV